jgi:hypothetical protein
MGIIRDAANRGASILVVKEASARSEGTPSYPRASAGAEEIASRIGEAREFCVVLVRCLRGIRQAGAPMRSREGAPPAPPRGTAREPGRTTWGAATGTIACHKIRSHPRRSKRRPL